MRLKNHHSNAELAFKKRGNKINKSKYSPLHVIKSMPKSSDCSKVKGTSMREFTMYYCIFYQ